MKPKNFIVNSHQELLNHLRNIDLVHPPISHGVNKEQIERNLAFRLLSTFSNQSPFSFPLNVVHEDKPDFRFLMDSICIGAECTMVMAKDIGNTLFVRNKHFPNALIDLSAFRYGTEKHTSAEISELLSRNRLTGEPWYGDSVEREWSFTIMDCLREKTVKLNKRNFKKFHINWILIEDHIPKANLSIQTAIDFLMQPIKAYFNLEEQTKFDAIFIKTYGQWIRISSTQCDVRPVNDIWQKHYY